MPHPETRDGGTEPTQSPAVRISIKAEHVYTGVTFAGLHLQVEAPSAEEAQRLVDEFWRRFEKRDALGTPTAGGASIVSENPDISAQSERGPLDPATLKRLKAKIRERIAKTGTTQGAIAREAGIGEGHLSAVLSGRAGLAPDKQLRLFERLQSPAS